MAKAGAVRWQGAAKRWGFEGTIPPPGKRLAALLDRQPGWRRFHADPWAVIHVNDAQWQVLQAAR